MPSIVHEGLRSSGRPLDAVTRAFMEPRFGHDFSHVRIHTDRQAAESARAVGARAYTVGQSIVFGAGSFAPATEQGRHLLAHELTHTVQQPKAGGSLRTSREDSHLEANAATVGRQVVNGKRISQGIPAGDIQLSRQADPEAERKKAIEEANAVIAEIEATEKEVEAPSPAKKKASQFSPGGFSDAEAEKLLKEAEARTALMTMALTLAEKQARRRELWPSDYTSDNVKLAFDLDLYWDPDKGQFIRQDYVFQQEAVVNADPDAKRAYDDHYWDLTENKPVKKSRFDAVIGFVCKHTEPCSSNMEQFHKDRESGMSRAEAINRGMARLTVFAETLALPGKGPSGPIEIGPRVRPGMPFDLPASETAKSGAPERHAAPTGAPTPPGPPAPSELAKTAHPAELAKTAHPEALAKTAHPPELAKTATPEALAKTAPGTAEQPAGSRTQPSAPPAPRAPAPAAGRATAARRVTATPVSAEDVAVAQRANPDSVRKSWHPFWHEQMWLLDGGKGPAPRAFRAGRVIIVHPDFPL